MIIFLSQFFSNTLKPFLIYFTLETVSTCLFSQLQSLFISSYKSSSSNTNKSTTSATHRNLNNFKTMTTVRIVFSILLLLYHVIGNGFLVYYLTEMVRHVRNSKITKETFEYDADYEMYSPLFVDLRLTSFFCLIPMIHGFGRVLQQSVISFSIMTISQKNHDLKEEHFTKQEGVKY
ncbi:hypothetical protein C9374_003021 [Naegleria lovaniensis]|uniref:Uncharacterized protein n=1 Tax=Naegleria lovaniensis TaxID=51637 RepID=A0AA88KPY8_NAELO|nr:uncharacterized protein C9374_003021 [Naegleria lovaniensis]KAG2385872.1 hypothetical protein C9374_003021 [Naegleria lovaniensis]